MKDLQHRIILVVPNSGRQSISTYRELDRGFRARYWFACFVHNSPGDGSRRVELNFNILRVFEGQLPPQVRVIRVGNNDI